MTVASASLGSDLKVMGLVGAAHWASHFFQLALPPLFLILKDEFGVSYAALGLLPTLLYGASGFAQTAAGFLVDRFGARRVLLSGLTLLALSVLAAGFVTEYWMFMPLMVLAGLGNSVFHPADLAILTSKVSHGRIGRAYGAHALFGNLGWASAPALVGFIAVMWDWRAALIVAGCLGLVIVAAFLLWGADLSDETEKTPATAKRDDTSPSVLTNIRLLFSATIVSCFLYFAFLAMALIGVQSFGVTAMVQIYGVPLAAATAALTGYLLGSAAGVFVGGFAADRTDRHDLIAISGMITAGLIIIAIGAGLPPTALLVAALSVAGFVSGITSPSRDMLVRKATPAGASGRVFGFVYSGLDLGSALMPVTLGLILDRGAPELVFYAIAGLLFCTALTVVQVRRRTPTRPLQPAADA